MLTIILSLFGLYFCTAVDYSSSANGGLKNVMYYGDWSVWGGQDEFYPAAMPADQLTHLNFAFLDFDSDGEIKLTDAGAAHSVTLGVEGVTWGDSNAGVLPALQDLRAKYPNLRIGVSLGGWSKSGDFVAVAKDDAKRAKFINQVAKFVEYNNMDFIDVDWEYPGSMRNPDLVDNTNDEGTPNATPEDGKLFIQLLKDLKAKENTMAQQNNRVYELSVALPGTSGNMQNGAQAFLPPGVTKDTATVDQNRTAATEYCKQLFDTIDFGNLMTYDLRGAWDPRTGHHTALYSHHSNDDAMNKLDFSADALVSYLLGKTTDSRGNTLPTYLNAGVSPKKIVVGVALYTRGWHQAANDGFFPSEYPYFLGTVSKTLKDADNSLSAGANNQAECKNGDGGRLGGVWSYGRLDKLRLAYPGLTYKWDAISEAPYLYSTSGAFFTYDSPKSVAAKAQYVKDKGLAGIIGWMSSNDAETGDETTATYSTGAVRGIRGILTKAAKVGLFGSGALDKFNIGSPTMKVTATPSVGVGEYNGQPAYIIKIENKWVLKETNAALALAEKSAAGIAFPKIYVTLKDGITVPAGSKYGSGSWTQEGNVVTVDLSSTDTFKVLDPQETATLELIPTAQADTPLDVSDIVKVVIGRKIYKNGKEVARAVIFGEGSVGEWGDDDDDDDGNGGNNNNNGGGDDDDDDDGGSSNNKSKKRMPAGAVVGIVFAVLFVVGAAVAVGVFIVYRMKNSPSSGGGGDKASVLYQDQGQGGQVQGQLQEAQLPEGQYEQ